MTTDLRIRQLEEQVAQLSEQHRAAGEQTPRSTRRNGWRSRWAAIGAAVAVTLGGGTAIHHASAAPGDVVQNSFVPLEPVRILDTRPAPENVGGFVGPLGPDGTHTFQVAGLNGVPSNASAVVMNMTVTATTSSSFLKVFPAGTTPPTVSNLNWTAGTTIPNLVTVQLGTTGEVTVLNRFGNTHVIADLAGYYVPGSDKFVTIDVLGHPDDTATFNSGFGAFGGLRFADGVNQSASFHLVLPPDYTPGTELVGTFTWHTPALACGVDWRPDFTSVSRPGRSHLLGGTASSGLSLPGVQLATATSNLVQSATFTLNSPDPSAPLRPGDSYTFGIFRAGSSGADTCADWASIDSIVIRYE